MKRLLYILMFVTLGVAMSCEEDPNPGKRYIDLYVGGKKVKAEVVSADGVADPPPDGWKCSASNLCCGPFGTQYRCIQY